MPNTIQIKRSSTASAAPAANQLAAGELAINTADGKLFAKNSAGTVINLPVKSIEGEEINPSQIGIGTTTPATDLQICTGGASSTLPGSAQTEIFQVIDASGADYVNLGRFHCNSAASRGSFSLSNSGTNGEWADNVMQFFVHGSSYGYAYYGGNTTDAGAAMIVTQGSDITKLQIGNYGNAPIEFFTNNARCAQFSAEGNVTYYKSIDTDFTNSTELSFYNTYDGGSGEISNIASIRCVTGSTANLGTLVFATGDTGVLTDRMIINENGHVGIGVASPGARLDVRRTSTYVLLCDSTYITAAFGPREINDGFCTVTYSWTTATSGSYWQTDYSSGSMRISRNLAGVNSGNFFTILSSGNVGIGTTSPAVKLDVVGDIKLTGALRSPGEMLYLWSNFR